MLSAQEAEAKEAEEEEEKTVWRTEGSDYIGKKVRRYVFDARDRLTDAADGVIVGWLSKEEADYLAEASGEPAPLWHMTYDDARIGNEDLEEHEVLEAIELMDQPLPEKVQIKYQKRLEIVALQQAKKKERDEKQKAKEDSKMLRALQQLDKDAQKKERERSRQGRDGAKGLEGWGDKDAKDEENEPTVDEADVLIASGKYKGIRSKNVPRPAGSKDVFPSAELSDDFISIYTFLHDLSAPLGAAKMDIDDVLGCLVPPSTTDDDDAKASSVEAFLEVGKFLTEIASRSLWIRDSDEEVMEEVRNRDVCDIALAPGPLLSATANDATVKYSCWQLCNETSWPEIARILLLRRTEVIKEGPLVELCETLAVMEPGHLSVEQKVKLLRFLCDEASAGDRVHRVLNDKLKQIDRILDKKRTEDYALKNKGGAGGKKVAKSKGTAGVEKEGGDGADEASGAAAEGGAEGGGDKDGGVHGRPVGSRTCFEVMLAIADKEPTATFEIKHKGNVSTGSIDKNGIMPRIVCKGHEYDTPTHWIKAATGISKFAAKAMILYKGEKIKSVEESFEFPLDAGRKGGGAQRERSEVDTLMSEFRDESLLNIDTERRKREIQAALKRAQKGLRYEPVGYDRWHRSYWCFDGISDRLWVHSLAQPSEAPANRGGQAKKATVVAGCWQSSKDFGIDGRASEEYKKLGVQAQTGADWAVYCKNDGTLQALTEVLSSGPNGKREAALLEALRERGMLDGLSGAGEGGKDAVSSSSPTQPQKDDNEMKDGHMRSFKPRGDDSYKDKEEGYEWNELPSIGDLAWARLGEGHKRAWYPVLITEPPAAAAPEEDDAQTESDDDEDAEDEWQSSGSDYLGKRLMVEVSGGGRRGEKLLALGRITGWLPKELADFTSEVTNEAAALWRLKFEDRKLKFQDLEEFEVKEGIIRWMREESKKKSEASQVLSSRSMFGQTITKVHTRLFNDDESVEILGLNDLQPYLPFKEQHEQEMRRAGKTRVLQQVMLANQYLEEHGSSVDREVDLAELMRKLGIANRSEGDLSAEMRASTKHCAHFPRILNVVQENRDNLPWITTPKELKRQLQAICAKLLVSVALHDKLSKKVGACKSKADEAETREQLMECILELESVLHDAVMEKEEGDMCSHIDLDEWRVEGHEFIDKRIRRPVKGAFGRVVKMQEARIVGWLPADESDYTNAKGEAAALWHILWDDGQEEDLEEWEVLESLEASIDSEDEFVRGGIWSNGRDRKEWLSLMSQQNCRTVGATALGLYLFGDRALPMVADICQQLLHSAEESEDHCFICFDGGKLVCCDECPRTVHYQCVGLARPPKEKDR